MDFRLITPDTLPSISVATW